MSAGQPIPVAVHIGLSNEQNKLISMSVIQFAPVMLAIVAVILQVVVPVQRVQNADKRIDGGTGSRTGRKRPPARS